MRDGWRMTGVGSRRSTDIRSGRIEGLFSRRGTEEVQILLGSEMLRSHDVFAPDRRSSDFIGRDFVSAGENEPHSSGDSS